MSRAEVCAVGLRPTELHVDWRARSVEGGDRSTGDGLVEKLALIHPQNSPVRRERLQRRQAKRGGWECPADCDVVRCARGHDLDVAVADNAGAARIDEAQTLERGVQP